MRAGAPSRPVRFPGRPCGILSHRPRIMQTTEFALAAPVRSDRRTPLRWILSHARRQAWLLLTLLAGAVGNAALAAVVPVLVGQAFNVMAGDAPDLRRIGTLALVISGSQVVRGLLQLLRNFSAELSAQRGPH